MARSAIPPLTVLALRIADLCRQNRDKHGRFAPGDPVSWPNDDAWHAPMTPAVRASLARVAAMTPEQRDALNLRAQIPGMIVHQCASCYKMLSGPMKGHYLGMKSDKTSHGLCPRCTGRYFDVTLHPFLERRDYSASDIAARRAFYVQQGNAERTPYPDPSLRDDQTSPPSSQDEQARLRRADIVRQRRGTSRNARVRKPRQRNAHVKPPKAKLPKVAAPSVPNVDHVQGAGGQIIDNIGVGTGRLAAVREGLTRLQVATVTRDFTDVVYDAAKHPRDARGRYIGGSGANALAHMREAAHVTSFLNHHGVEALRVYATHGKAAQRAYLAALQYGEHTGQKAIHAHLKTLLELSKAQAAQMSHRDAQNLAALHQIYQQQLDASAQLPGNNPAKMQYAMRTQLHAEQERIMTALRQYNTAQRAAGHSTKVSLSAKAMAKTVTTMDPADRRAITTHILRQSRMANAADVQARQQARREQALAAARERQAQRERLAKLVAEQQTKQSEAMQRLFGRQLTQEDFQQILPGVSPSGVHMEANDTNKSLSMTLHLGDPDTRASTGLSMVFGRRAGKLYVDVGWAKNADGGEAVAGRTILRTMQYFQALGVSQLHASAAGTPGGSLNGYYTWPRMGFTGKIPDTVLAAAQQQFGNVTRVEQIFAKPGGAKWWKDHGATFEATFNFTPGSHSRRIFDRLSQAVAQRLRLALIQRLHHVRGA